MPTPVRIVKVLAQGALVLFSDGSTRQVMPEAIEGWKRFGMGVTEGDVSPEDVERYRVMFEIAPWYSGIIGETSWGKNITEALAPEVVEQEPEVTAADYDRATMEILSSTEGSPLTSAPTIERPRTIAQAQSTGSIYYWSKGKKKLAIYANQLETFKLSQAYKEGEGSALSQARKWMEAQVLSGNSINFNSVGGIPKEVLSEDWETLEGWHDTGRTRTIGDEEVRVQHPDIIPTGFDTLDKGRQELWNWLYRASEPAAAFLANRFMDKEDAPVVAEVKSQLPAELQDALASGVGVGDAFIAAQQEKAGLLPDVDFAPTDPETQLVGADVVADAVPAMEPGMLEKIYNYGPFDLPSIKDIADYGGAFNWPSTTDIVSTAKEAGRDVLDWATTPEVLAVTEEPVETDFDAYARAQRLAAEYGDMYQEEFSDFPYNRGINASGTNLAYREPPTWEERYPLAPQGPYRDQVDTSLAGLADNQWIDPHPDAINIDLGEYYKIPPDKRHLFKKPPESDWDVSKSGGSVWDRERRAAIEGRGMVDEFGEIQKQAEQDAIDKAALDEWWAQAHAAPDTYGDELGEYDQYGTLSGMQEGVGMTQGIPDPLQRVETAPIVPQVDGLNPPWMGVDEDALPYNPDIRYGDRRKEVGDFDNFVGDTNFREYTDRNPDVLEGLSSEKVNTLLDNPALQEAYLRERWYLTNQKFFARDYKESELVRPLVSREPEFFKLM